MTQNITISNQAKATPMAAANAVMPTWKPLYDNEIKEPLKHLPIQRKLAIAAANNPLEDEADMMADKVMRMPEKSFIQRKCNHCEGEENDGIAQRKPLLPFIQKKENGNSGGMASNTVTNQINTTKGNGPGMDNQTQSFMESRFGTSFQDVRIHADGQAAQLSQQLNAQAFTVGNDVYFNQHKYAPNTNEGKHLLAHELTHTLQQSGGVWRTPGEYTILGLDENRATQPNFIFFEMNKPDNATTPQNDLDVDEQDKIATFADRNPDGIQLNGFASEEGQEANNHNLINLRLQAVKNVLTAAPISYADPITTTALFNASHNQFDYRFWRVVEMLPAGGTSSRVQSAATAANRGLEACSTDNQNNIIVPARNRAVNNIGTTITALDNFISNPTANPTTGNALQTVFRSNTTNTANEVKRRLDANRTFLNGMMSILHCGTEQSVDCGETAEALTNPRSITLCHHFFTDQTIDARATTLVHESSHGSRFELNDRAYRSERVVNIINTRQALDNAESFAIFVETIVLGAPIVHVGPEDSDMVGNCGAYEQMVRAAVSWAERWNTYAVFGLQQTYGNDGNTAAMQPHISFYFGNVNRSMLAGILDKYTAMMAFFDAGNINIKCVDHNDPLYRTWKIAEWSGRTVKISVEQLRQSYLNAEDRVKYIYGALATDLFGVPEEHRMAYPNVARAYKIFFWQAEG